jgi:ribosomal-protein-alanine N-acetyltransferase
MTENKVHMDLSNITIETENLILKSIDLDFKKEIFKEFTPEITIYMFPKSPEKIEETIEFIETSKKKNKEGEELQIVILNKNSQEFIGCGGLHGTKTKTPELGIWIKKSAHGKKYGREAMTALKKWADENIVYEYILYPVVDKNTPSRKIPESLGGKVFREYEKTNLSGYTWNFLEYRIYPS